MLDMNKLEFKNKIFTVGDVSFEMVAVHGGTFVMGTADDPDGEAGDDEKPAHKVYLSDYYLGKYEVTRELWRAVMVSDPPEISMINDDTCPVEKISWFDAMEFIEKLNAMTGEKFRLPTEAEWEYACRAGTETKWYFGDTQTDWLTKWAYVGGGGGESSDVGQRNPNPWGFYDFYGNAGEWCADSSESTTEPGSTVDYPPYRETDVTENPLKTTGERRVIRGLPSNYNLSSGYRWTFAPTVDNYANLGQGYFGFRLVRPAQMPAAE